MPKNTERFTVYMTEGERLALRLAARQLSLSENAVMKLLVRNATGLPVPTIYADQLRRLADSPVLSSQIHL